jgi:hypothetical protein
MLGQQLVVPVGPAVESSQRLRITSVADIAQCHEGVAPEVAGVALRDIPTPVGIYELIVGGHQQIEEVDGGH